MNPLTTTLTKMEEVKKPQRCFMEALFAVLMAFVGRATMKNLSRYGDISVRQIRYWASGGKHKDKDMFDFFRFNLKLVEDAGVIVHKTILAIDATFLEKTGKMTHGLGWFYNGCNNRAERGLEATVISLIDVEERTAYSLCAEQTPPKNKEDIDRDETSIDFAVVLLSKISEFLLKYTNMIVGDGAYAKTKFINGAMNLHLHLTSRLRIDARIRYYYKGSRTGKRGRPKTYDGRVTFDNLHRMDIETVTVGKKDVKIHTDIVHHTTFKRSIKVIIFVDGEKITGILFSTDTSLSAAYIVELYSLRFQIEFIFRDAKQYTGLGEFQVRDENGINFFINSSLSTLNLMRFEDRKAQKSKPNRVISIASWKRLKYNEKYMKRICLSLGINHDIIKNHPRYQETLRYGAYAA